MARAPVSAVIITRDAERLLADVPASLSWCDETLVVDSGSADRTVAIARVYGARVMEHPFDGFGVAKVALRFPGTFLHQHFVRAHALNGRQAPDARTGA